MTRAELMALGLMALVSIFAICAWFTVTTPDLSDLPAYECAPGHHHTTKECAR